MITASHIFWLFLSKSPHWLCYSQLASSGCQNSCTEMSSFSFSFCILLTFNFAHSRAWILSTGKKFHLGEENQGRTSKFATSSYHMTLANHNFDLLLGRYG